MNLGEVRDALAKAEPGARVVFWPFSLLFWGKIDSWRGSYDEPAVGYSFETMTAAEALKDVDKVLGGKAFEGYKGGTYSYRRSSELHVDNWSEYTDGLTIESIDTSDPYEVRVHLSRVAS